MSQQELLNAVEASFIKEEVPFLLPGDTVRVNVLIKEGNKERIQAFEGVIIKVARSGINKTFTVRKVFQGIGVERCFLLHSPRVDSVQILRRGQVRRSRLYYLRERAGKAARIKEKATGICAPGKAGSLVVAKENKGRIKKRGRKKDKAAAAAE